MTKCSCPTLKAVIEASVRHFQHPLFNLDGFKAEGKGTVTYFASQICETEAAQFEIRADLESQTGGRQLKSHKPTDPAWE